MRSLYTVEWGVYEKYSKVQTGDQELMAESKEDAISKSYAPPIKDRKKQWVHAYLGPSKWL